MYYVWQQRLFSSIVMLNETPIEIIHPGQRNRDAGPAFFNAKVKFDNMVWAGNIEMNVKASDWYKHNSQNNPAYNNVILHVVLAADTEVGRPSSGDAIKTVVMHIPDDVMQRYQHLMSSKPYPFSIIRCGNRIAQIPPYILTDWKSSLAVKRMLTKARFIQNLVETQKDSWQEAFYVILCRSLGTSINSDASESLARSLPYSFLQKHLDQPLQVEALLLGQAGLIDKDSARLQQEYDFLRAKFQLTPLDGSCWNRSSLRPFAAPERRLHALMLLLCSHGNLFSEILEAPDLAALQKIFTIPNYIGQQTANSLIINAIIPIMIAYGEWKDDEDLCNRAIEMLELLPPESNRYINYWEQTGMPLRNAFDSQALLHLYREYCEPRKCMNCRLGCWLIYHKEEQA